MPRDALVYIIMCIVTHLEKRLRNIMRGYDNFLQYTNTRTLYI